MVAATTTAAETSSSSTAADSDTVVANHGETTASPEDIVDLAAAVQQALHQQEHTSNAAAASVPPPPQALPLGWFLKEARSQPGCYYYFNMDTGVSTWASPIVTVAENEAAHANEWEDENNLIPDHHHHEPAHFLEGAANVSPTTDAKDDPPQDWSSSSTADVSMTKKRTRNEVDSSSAARAPAAEAEPPSQQRPRVDNNDKPKQVRVLHILRKHKDSRRPSSWRQPIITATREQAVQDLRGLQELLSEVQGDPAELRATLEELARTESDCSSAKRGGDLGFFGPKKMQPAFEDAAFALKVGEMSDIVETASGMHLILRIG